MWNKMSREWRNKKQICPNGNVLEATRNKETENVKEKHLNPINPNNKNLNTQNKTHNKPFRLKKNIGNRY